MVKLNKKALKHANNNQPFANKTGVKAAAATYWDHDLTAIPYHREKGFAQIKWKKGDVDHFKSLAKFSPVSNIELLCGVKFGGLVDVDIDDDLTAQIAGEILPKTACVFGRKSRRGTHYLFRVDNKIKFKSYRTIFSISPRPLVELRGHKCSVRVPPSIHPISGEVVEFEAGRAGLPAKVSSVELELKVRLLAVTGLLVNIWPKEQGCRHELALAMSGFLCKAGLTSGDIITAIKIAAMSAGDEGLDDRVQAAKDTIEKFESGSAFTGAAKIRDLLGSKGNEIVKSITKWFGYDENQTVPLNISEYVISTNKLFKKDHPKPHDIIKHLIKAQTINLIYAQPKVGKTWLGMELAVCMAKGRAFLGHDTIETRPILYIDGEMTESEMNDRFQKLNGGANNLFLLNKVALEFDQNSVLDLTKDAVQKEIEKAVLDHGIDVLFIDTMTSLVPRNDENDNSSKELRSFLLFVKKLKKDGVATFLIHHSGHDGKHPRGASSLEGAVDSVIRLRGKGESNIIEMEFIRTRYKKPDPSKYGFQINDDESIVTIAPIAIGEKPKARPEHKILPYLLKKSYVTQKQLAEAMGIGFSTLNVYVKNLRSAKIITTKPLQLTAKGKEIALSMT